MSHRPTLRFMLQKTHFLRPHFGQIPWKTPRQTQHLNFQAPAVQLWFIISTIILSICWYYVVYYLSTVQWFYKKRRTIFSHFHAGWPWWPWWHQPSSHYLHGKSFEYLRRISMQSDYFHSCVPRRAHARGRACRRKKAQSNILVSSNPSQSRVEMMRAYMGIH